MADTTTSRRIPTSIWENPEWTALSSSDQLFALTCMLFAPSGPLTNERLIRRTGWAAEYIEDRRESLASTPFAHLAVGREKRRRLPRSVVATVMERDGRRCVQCSSVEILQVDHIHPVARGGSDDIENLQILCRTCNLRKGARVA